MLCSWISKLFANLSAGVSAARPHRIFDKLTVVNFNYDRCMELVLHELLVRSLALEPDDAAAVMSELKIYHPYGQVGRLPWQSTESEPTIQFGENVTPSQLWEVSNSIRTLTEGHQSGDDIHLIRQAVMQANQVAFLGFGFHQQNVNLLTSDGGESRDVTVNLTTYGAAHEQIQEYIHRAQRVSKSARTPWAVPAICDDAMARLSPQMFA